MIFFANKSSGSFSPGTSILSKSLHIFIYHILRLFFSLLLLFDLFVFKIALIAWTILAPRIY